MIFIDYHGSNDPNTGHDHVGYRAISANRPSSIVALLSPGVQGIDREVWEAIRSCKALGWDPKMKEYNGWLMEEGQIKILPDKIGKAVDWGKVRKADMLGEKGIIARTVQPAILDSLRKHAVAEQWDKVTAAVEKHLEDILKGFDGKTIDVASAQARFPQAIGN